MQALNGPMACLDKLSLDKTALEILEAQLA
jgi:hypothetical protein